MIKSKFKSPSHLNMQPFNVSIVEFIPAQTPELKELEQILSESEILVNKITYNQDTLEILNELHPELIFIAPSYPLSSSIKFIHALQAHPAHLSVPLIFFTTNEEIIKQVSAITLEGVGLLLIPPIQADSFIASIKASILRFRSIKAQMSHDSLTGLLNQNATVEQLEIEVARAKRDKTSLSLAMLDIDHFKKINDTYGHLIGNQVLKYLANILKQRLRKSDSIGRYGGDEFILILPATQTLMLPTVLTEIKNRFLEYHPANKTESLTLTFSAGVAHLSSDLWSATKLIQAADEALYQAKHQGRNQIVIAPNSRHSTQEENRNE